MEVCHMLPARWALENLRRQRLKVAHFRDLNDPFELLGADLTGEKRRRQFDEHWNRAVENWGVLCFAQDWHNPVLWSLYADKHRGICLRFEVPDSAVLPVEYVDERQSVDDLATGIGSGEPGVLFRLKFRAWEHERELRRIVPLAEADNQEGRFFWPFGRERGLELREVLVGPRCQLDDECVADALGDHAGRVRITKTRLAFKSYQVVLQKRGFRGTRREELRAGRPQDIRRGSGDWIFVDLGFSANGATCGFLEGDGQPQALTFAAATGKVVKATSSPGAALNLVLEAPLSIAFNAAGNPTGRSVEKREESTRYWYVGLGCSVMVAAMQLVNAIAAAGVRREVRLFEGLVSFKPKAQRSRHTDDVLLLRDLVWRPGQHAEAIIPADKLAILPTDRLSSPFVLPDHDIGIPPVIAAGATTA